MPKKLWRTCSDFVSRVFMLCYIMIVRYCFAYSTYVCYPIQTIHVQFRRNSHATQRCTHALGLLFLRCLAVFWADIIQCSCCFWKLLISSLLCLFTSRLPCSASIILPSCLSFSLLWECYELFPYNFSNMTVHGDIVFRNKMAVTFLAFCDV